MIATGNVGPESVEVRAQPAVRKLSLEQVHKLIENRTPDAAIARELESRGAEFVIDDESIKEIASYGAGPRTLDTLRTLQPRGVLIVKVGQPGIAVKVGSPRDNLYYEKPVGVTGADGTVRLELPVGTKQIETSSPIHTTVATTVQIVADKETESVVVLELAPVRTANKPKVAIDARPLYPPDAYRGRVQGSVLIEVLTAPDGKVRDAKILRSIPLLDEAALEAVRRRTYEPQSIGGIARPLIFVEIVQFSWLPRN